MDFELKTTTLDKFKNILACGEDSSHQFKRDFSNAEALAAELIAFANTIGGVDHAGSGLTF